MSVHFSEIPKRELKPQRGWFSGRTNEAVIICFIIGSLITGLVTHQAWQDSVDNFEIAHQQEGLLLTQKVQETMSKHVADLVATAALLSTAEDVDEARFRRFIGMLNLHSDIISLVAWAPKQFERDKTGGEAPIRDLLLLGAVQDAPSRPVSFPIKYVWPATNTEQAKDWRGVDAVSKRIPERTAISAPALYDNRVLYDPVRIHHGGAAGNKLIILVPVHPDPAATTDHDIKHSSGAGYLVSIMDVNAAFGPALSGNTLIRQHISIINEYPVRPYAERFYLQLAEPAQPLSVWQTRLYDLLGLAAYAETFPMDVGEKWWSVHVLPLSSEVFRHILTVPLRVMAGGLLITAVLCIYLVQQGRRQTELRTTAAALKEKEGSLRSAQKIARMGSWHFSIAERTIQRSPNLDQLLSIDSETETKGYEKFLQRVHPDDRDTLVNARTQAIANGTDVDVEYRYRHPDGTEYIFHELAEPTFGPGGRAVGLTGTVQDITVRRKDEKKLAHMSTLLRAVFRDIPDCMVLADPNRNILHVSNSVTKVFGYDPQEIVGQSTRIFYADPAQYETQGKIRYNPNEKLKTLGATAYTVEYQRKDGRMFHGETIGTPVHDENNNVVGYLAVMRDISDRLVSERRLKENEQRFRSIFTEASQGILVHKDMKPTYVNHAFAEMFGFDTIDEVMALDSIAPLIKENDLSLLQSYHNARAAGDDAPAEYEFTGVKRDGTEINVRNRAVTVPWGDDVVICANMFDITGEIKTQRALKNASRMEAVGQLTGGIAHDFNNLLGIIMGNTDLVRTMARDIPKAGDRLDAVIRAAKRGRDLTRRLLAFSRQEVKEGQFINVNDVINEMDDLVSRTLTSEVEMQFALADDLWTVKVDPGDLGDVLINLSVNSRDAMPNGGQLLIETENQSIGPGQIINKEELTPGDYVIITMSDTGEGMSPEVRDKVFEPFFTTKEVGKGTGLGLSMVYGFIRRSGGDISIYSELGRGTRIRLYIPRADFSEDADTASPVATQPMPEMANTDGDAGDPPPFLSPATSPETSKFSAKAPPQDIRILVVDDEPDLLTATSDILRKIGYKTITAANAQEALSILAGPIGTSIDLMLTDVVMPGGTTGFDLAQEIEQKHPGISVLVTSGFTGKLNGHGARSSGNRAILHKPFDERSLAATVAKALNDRRRKETQAA